MAATVVPVPGAKGTQRRAVTYLVRPEDAEVTAGPVIERLKKSDGSEKSKVWSRFDYWVDEGVHKKYFHGWDEPEFKHCFVFKWNKGGADEATMQRLYGTLFHPRPKTNPGFMVCVLFSHCVKYGKYTDPEQKRKAEELYVDTEVIAAVKKRYPDK